MGKYVVEFCTHFTLFRFSYIVSVPSYRTVNSVHSSIKFNLQSLNCEDKMKLGKKCHAAYVVYMCDGKIMVNWW